jgi:dihydroflavonol-4-reductase
MRILVTGATGFIGSRLALAARAKGYDVVAGGRKMHDALRMLFTNAGIEVRLGDVTDAAYVDSVVAGVTHICHLAAAWQEVGVGDDYFRKVTLTGTQNVAKAAVKHRVSKMVHCSTTGVHSRSSGLVISETSPIEVVNAYETAKIDAEKMLTAEAASTGLQTIILRPADGYGPGDMRLLKLFRGVAKQRFPLVGPGTGHRHMIYVDDICDAFLAACVAPVTQPEAVIIAGPEVVTLRELIERMARVLGVPKYGFDLPLGPMRIAAAVTEDVCGVLKVSPPLYRRRLDFYTVDAQYDLRKAKAVLNWEPQTGLDTGLRLSAQWYRNRGLL